MEEITTELYLQKQPDCQVVGTTVGQLTALHAGDITVKCFRNTPVDAGQTADTSPDFLYEYSRASRDHVTWISNVLYIHKVND